MRRLVFGLNDRGRLVGAYENTEATTGAPRAGVERMRPLSGPLMAEGR